MQLAHFAAQRRHEQLHEEGDFLGRAAPVLGTEGEQGQVADATACRSFDRGAHGIKATAVPGHARQVTLGGPAAVAVHDDGNVARRIGGVRHRLCRADMHESGFPPPTHDAPALGDGLTPS